MELLEFLSSTPIQSTIAVGMAANKPTLSLSPASGIAVSYFTASFLASADLDTMREAALVSAPVGEHVAIDWSCLAGLVDLLNALTLIYSTQRGIKFIYITVPKLAPGDDGAAATAVGFSDHSLRPATRFQNLVYDNQNVHWSVVGKLIHTVRKHNPLPSSLEYHRKSSWCLTIATLFQSSRTLSGLRPRSLTR